MTSNPVYSFGILSDIQYADLPNGHNYAKTTVRYYRNALQCVQRAVRAWQKDIGISFILQLGDIIDGINSSAKGDYKSKQALAKVLNELDKFKHPTYHVLGNHEFYNFNREFLLTSPLNSTQMETVSTLQKGITMYYHFAPAEGFRVIVLDAYDISMLGYKKSDMQYQTAKTILLQENPNSDLNGSDGLSFNKRRFVKFNGSIGEKQQAWLESTLTEADKLNEIVLVACKYTYIGLMYILI